MSLSLQNKKNWDYRVPKCLGKYKYLHLPSSVINPIQNGALNCSDHNKFNLNVITPWTVQASGLFPHLQLFRCFQHFRTFKEQSQIARKKRCMSMKGIKIFLFLQLHKDQAEMSCKVSQNIWQSLKIHVLKTAINIAGLTQTQVRPKMNEDGNEI